MAIILNPEQRIMVESEGNIVVTACPGSGKTRALTSKISYELERLGSSKRRVIALTFTNRAAEEIQKRLDNMNVDTENLWTGTIHAFCLEWILRPYASYVERLKNGFTVIDEFRQEKILAELKEASDISRFESVSVKWNREGCIKQDTPIKQYIADEYNQKLIQSKLIDFDLILHLSFSLLQQRPQISSSLSRIFKLICVDEYQDTSDLQYGILGSIVREGKGLTNILMVGDPDQAIYDTLGGIAKSLDEISLEIGGYSIRKIEFSGNYRSAQRIIDYYRNFQLTSIDIKAVGKNANSDTIIKFNNQIFQDSIVEEIAKIIRDNLNNGIPAHEICVIAPQWWMLISMARRLKSLMPDVQFDAPGLSPLPRSHDNFWFKVARIFLTDPSPDIFVSRNRWAEEIIRELKLYTNQSEINTDHGPLTARNLLNFSNKAKKSFSNDIEGLVFLNTCFNNLLKFVNINIVSYTLLNEHHNSFFNGVVERLSRREFEGISRSLGDFRNMFRHSNGVVVNTCQGVKGEEYETVIAYGLLQGYVPHGSIRDEMQAELSSKRLLYVIGSRAKRNLHLIAELGRNRSTNRELEAVQFTYDD
ncbi:UvrD-helicase domain-containing protein [Paenibacillus polymyxa]|uniref:UvrD-helicase domain-containing protein n=1 Tax=Paenibacillus polymyxa TaxID=1406 RepID=UPI002377F33B|nr:ATP-dependent helicase [Paenibacillus polymyxa]WDM22298.1 ATP-dependent helicase [Paenibacillus polymyxa]